MPAVRQTLDEASAALDLDIGRLIREGPKDQLDLTTNTQPVMLTAGVACYRAWLAETRATPAVVAGHSLGEYSALVVAGALSFATPCRWCAFAPRRCRRRCRSARARWRRSSASMPPRCVAGCAQAAIDTGEVVEAANFNDPKQIVIAGTKAGVDRACELLKAAGAKRTLLLAVSAPFHSQLMKPAAERLRERLTTVAIAAPSIPVIDNIDVRSESDPALIRDALYRQSFGAVRWSETIQAIRARGVGHIFECGPGKVLAGMVTRIEPDAVAAAVADPTSLAAAAALLQ